MTTDLGLFLSVCVATALTSGLFNLAAAWLVARQISENNRLTGENTKAVNEYVAQRRQEVSQLLQSLGGRPAARPPTSPFVRDLFSGPKPPKPPTGDGNDPKGSA